jgi:N-acetylmuramoyl-L-alanine amidase
MTLDEHIGACTLYGEARGEPEVGQQAVAHVLWNRLASGRWGTTLHQVCQAHAQFSCWLHSDPNYEKLVALTDDNPTLIELLGVLNQAQTDSDFTQGAMYYFADSMTEMPSWAKNMAFTGHFGHQRFYRET